MRYLFAGLVGLGLLFGLGAVGPGSAPAAPLAQATATPTPTLPPVRNFGDGWGVQALPRAGVNCFVTLPFDNVAGSNLNCVPGTPVP